MLSSHRRLVLSFFVVSLAVPSIGLAQSAAIGVHDNYGQSGCNATVPTGFSIWPIKVDGTVGPIRTAKFKVIPSVPVPSIPAGGQDFNLTLSTCATAGSQISFLFINNPGAAIPNVRFSIKPYTGETAILLTDCTGISMLGEDTYSSYCDNQSFLLAPYQPIPANGAVNV